MCDLEIEKMLDEREDLLIHDYQAALDFAGFSPGEMILDVATGPGRMLLQLLKRGYEVISGDIDQEALRKAREYLSELAGKPTLIALDAHELHFEDGSFRSVTLANAVHEMKNPHGAFDEIRRVLSDSGTLLVVEFNSLGYELMEAYHKTQGRAHSKGEMSTEEIDAYLRQSFDEVQTRDLTITHAWTASGKEHRSF